MSKAQDSGYIAEYKVASHSGGSPQLNVTSPDAFHALGVRPGDRVGVRENGVGLILEPLDHPYRKRHTSSVYEVSILISEFEARMLGNRLWEVAEFYEKRDNSHLESEMKWWARRFHDECNTRKEQ